MKFVAHERFQYVLLKKFGECIEVLLIVQIGLEKFTFHQIALRFEIW